MKTKIIEAMILVLIIQKLYNHNHGKITISTYSTQASEATIIILKVESGLLYQPINQTKMWNDSIQIHITDASIERYSA